MRWGSLCAIVSDMKVTTKNNPPGFQDTSAACHPVGTVAQTDGNKLFVRIPDAGHGPLWMALEEPFVMYTGLSAARPVTIQEVVVVP